MLDRRALLTAAATLALPRLAFAGKAAAAAPIPPLPLTIGVVANGGVPVRDATWVDEQVTEAQALFTPLGILLSRVGSRPIASAHGKLESRADRDALAALLEPKRINVFIVDSLRDVDDPRLHRMGVHWRNRQRLAQHYVIVAASARPSTLAHELGHYFGLDHSSVKDNVMSYERSGGAVFFDDRQAERMRGTARMYVGGKHLDTAAPPAPAP
ncbi:hypothetical protein A7982_12789 [Minicystis rosea]|nr:hypothetical protein A7982_12789 [Minicystis rosea]